MSRMTQRPRRARLVYEVAGSRDEWFLSDDKVPESRPHDRASEAVFAQLDAMVARTRRDAIVCRNLAIRWVEERPGIGVDPDVCLIEPAPPEGEDLFSLLLWQTGHFPPLLAVEIVSSSRPGKDYAQSPEKYAANGTKELWVFDPRLAGPKAMSGPFRLQVWRRNEDDDFRRVYAGEGPAWSEALGAWVFAVNEGRSLRIADDEAGTSWWMTREEAERAAKEAERKEKEAERAAKEAERKEKEAERAAKEAERKEKEAERKEKEEALLRAERLAARLRELGVDPGSIH